MINKIIFLGIIVIAALSFILYRTHKKIHAIGVTELTLLMKREHMRVNHAM